VAEISLEGLTKIYPDGTKAVSSLDLEIADGELMVMVGPSGCGKTTALRMIAGLEDITDGVVRVADRVVNDLPPKDRDIAMVFQNYALYPHMNAYENIAFGLKMRGVAKHEIDRRVREASRILGLDEVLRKKPRTLSGGQRQRVAMGRAIVREPQAFLMDEPLSNLDAKLRVQMRAEIARIQRAIGVTTVYVTHDQSEAMTLGDRVAVMRGGLLQQVAPPQRLYERPANLFVAEFIGSPAMNLVEARIDRTAEGVWAHFGPHRLRVDDEALRVHAALGDFDGRDVALGIRPEDFDDTAVAGSAPPDRRLAAVVDIREDMGSEVFVHFSVSAPAVRTEQVREALEPETAEVQTTHSGTPFVARVSRETRAREGDQIELTVDTRRLHFFDPATGLAIGGGDTMERAEPRAAATRSG
jgi:multiple sugar transport system ATP-binding protein